MRTIRVFLAKARLRRLHAEIELHERDMAHAARRLDALLSVERRVRGELFWLEHPTLSPHRPTYNVVRP